jgi:uncharacterized RDD family membrane protein YckC
MKCPKCHYLSFEPEPRCKHCGYDFSLAEPDLTIRSHAADEDDDDRVPLADFRLRDTDVSRSAPMTLGPMRGATAAQPFAAVSSMAMTLEPPAPEPDFRSEPLMAKASPAPVTTELPLFVKGLAAAEAAAAAATAEPDAPLVKVPVAPRPLAVRRQAPDAGRVATAAAAEVKPARKLGPFDHDLLEDLQRIEAKAAGRPLPGRSTAEGWQNAGRRLTAAVIDLTFLAGLVATVIWFTLRQCDLSFAQARILPIVPMALFLGLIVVGYLFLFTAASGQTIGKMWLGLRVIGGPENVATEPPTLRQATYRSILTLPSVLMLGIGFLPALVGQGLALHDRLTHTRVIRA